MLDDELKQFLEDRHCLHRNRIRYNGTGPRLFGEPNKIWPRDSLDHQDETRKIIFALKEINLPKVSENRIKDVIKYIFVGFKHCNINNLFNKCCDLGPNYFGRTPFKINYALDAYTSYRQIFDFIHSVIRSIDGINKIGSSRHGRNYVHTIFGSNRNHDIFKKNLKWLIMSNAHVYEIRIDDFLHWGEKYMDLDQVGWLDGLEQRAKYKAYVQVLYAILRFIFELLRRYFYITLSNPYFDKLFYFRYDLWQRIFHAATKTLIAKGFLKELTIDPSVQIIPLANSKLRYHLKKDDVRPICTNFSRPSKTSHMDKSFEAVLKHVLQSTANYHKFSLMKLLAGLKYFKNRQAQGERIFFVRADIKDCFPSVNQNLLRRIILNILVSESADVGQVKIFKLFCKRIKDKKDVSRFCVNKDLFEQRHPHLNILRADDVSMDIGEFDQKYLTPCIMNPVIRESKCSKKGYLLKQGLRQGSSFSPILSSIYIQTAFNEHLGGLLDSDDCKIYRYVDDILFISTDIDQAKIFMDKMLHGFKAYNLTMNLEKLACNFECRVDPRLCRLTDNVIFHRQQICLKTLACRYNFNQESIQLLYSFRIHPRMNAKNILKSIYRSKWDYIHLDEELNGSGMVIVNIFERTLLLAHRAATMIIFSSFLSNTQDGNLVKKLVVFTTRKIYKAISLGVETNVIKNGLSYQQVRVIVAAAFETTWNRQRVSHRSIELGRLEHFRKRAMARYLFRPSSGTTDLDASIIKQNEFEAQVLKLSSEFPQSEFAQEVLIPSKDAKF